jgi:SAM-dependent methyltransferase
VTSGNIAYRGDQLAEYFAAARAQWHHLYPSERWIFERLAGAEQRLGRVLDVGCAAGGLASALLERFSVASYVGVDINRPVVELARRRLRGLPLPAVVWHGDILHMGALDGQPYDLVVSLSCADWNVETAAIIDACWSRVRPGGRLVISVRLTPGRGVNDYARSYQLIAADEARLDGCERANYVVFNGREFLRLVKGLGPAPDQVLGYGYWGRPSSTAVTPYERLVFAVFALRKAEAPGTEAACELHLPLSLLGAGAIG